MKPVFSFLPLIVFGLSASLGAEVLMIDFGPTNIAGDSLTNSPYHAANGAFSGTVWNKVEKEDVRVGQLRLADGTPAANVSIDLGATREAGVTQIDLGAKPDGAHALSGATHTGVYQDASPGSDAIYNGNKFDRSRAVGLQVLGLAPGTYDVYVVARNTNGADAQTQTIHVGTVEQAGNFDFTQANYPRQQLIYTDGDDATDVWREGRNYARFTIRLDAGHALNIATIGGEPGPRRERRGFINCVQIAPANPSTPPDPELLTTE